MSRWGLLDSTDGVWLGNAEGPVTYDDYAIARLAAMVSADSLGWPLTRVRATEYDDDATTLRDELRMKRSIRTSIRRLEKGTVT